MLCLPAGLEVAPQTLIHRDLGPPAQPGFGLFVGIAGLLPLGVPSPAIERRRQLALRPGVVFLPQPAQSVARSPGYVQRPEPMHVPFVEPQESSAGRKVVVHNVEDLAVDFLLHTRKQDGVGTIIDVSEWYGVTAAHMEEWAEAIDAHAAGDAGLSGTINRSGSYDHVRKSELPAVLGHYLVLLRLGVAVCFATALRLRFHRGRFVQQPRMLPRIGIHRERTDIHKPLQVRGLQARIQKIARRYHRAQ